MRIVGATNADLQALARQGRFRMDLLDRLAFDVINVPPLRARREDILPLAEHFAVNITSELGREFFAGFSDEARTTLINHEWPGNVRALKNAVERSVYRTAVPTEAITEIVFDPFISPFDWQPEAYGPEVGQPPGAERQKVAPATQSEADSPANLPMDMRAHLEDIEQSLIDQAMRAARFNQRKAAKLLSLSYHQLRGSLRKYGLVRKYGRKGGGGKNFEARAQSE